MTHSRLDLQRHRLADDAKVFVPLMGLLQQFIENEEEKRLVKALKWVLRIGVLMIAEKRVSCVAILRA